MNLLAVVEGVGQWSDDQEDEREGVTFIPVEVRRTNRGKAKLIDGEPFRAVIDDRFSAEFWKARLGAVVLLSCSFYDSVEDGRLCQITSVADVSTRADLPIRWKD